MVLDQRRQVMEVGTFTVDFRIAAHAASPRRQP